jgi:hypothetical protein
VDRLRPIQAFNPSTILGLATAISPCFSFSVTQDIGSDNAPFIQVHAKFLCLNIVALAAMAFPSAVAFQMQNLGTSFIIDFPGGEKRTLSRSSSTPTLPMSNNTRGDFIGELFVSALNPFPCTVPTAAGPTSGNQNIPGYGTIPESGYGINVINEPKNIA